jgi:hypothetical protein
VSVRGSAALTDCRCAPGADGPAGGPCFYTCSGQDGHSCGLVSIGNFAFTHTVTFTRWPGAVSLDLCNGYCRYRKYCVSLSYNSASQICNLGGCATPDCLTMPNSIPFWGYRIGTAVCSLIHLCTLVLDSGIPTCTLTLGLLD